MVLALGGAGLYFGEFFCSLDDPGLLASKIPSSLPLRNGSSSVSSASGLFGQC